MNKPWIKEVLDLNRVLNRQFKKIEKQEEKLLKKKEKKVISDGLEPIRKMLEKKIPDQLYYTLQAAFEVSFQMLFEKGGTYIEKTYKKDQKELEHEFLDFAMDKEMRSRYIRKMDRQANRSSLLNTSFSVLEGGALGFLGIGLPDIPLFIAVVMRNVYEIAMSYGYGYESDEERAYLLLLISGALAKDEESKKAYSRQIDELGQRIDQGQAFGIDLIEVMDETAGVIAEAMLIAKFIQGIPVVGTVGGIVNYSIIRKIGKLAGLKYKKRYLSKKQREKQQRAPVQTQLSAE